MSPIIPVGPVEPEIFGQALTGGTQPASIGETSVERNPALLKTGDHRIERFKALAAEWVPEDKGAIKFRDMVLEELERLVNNDPDYDTGYFEVKAGGLWYEINHNLGRVPTRYIIYLDSNNTGEPTTEKTHLVVMPPVYEQTAAGDDRYFRLMHNTGGTKSFITTAGDYIHGAYDTAHIRVLLWR